MDNLRLYNNLAAYSADVTRKYPTVSAINEGRGSIRYIKKIASDTSNLPLMNLARAANWVASDATYMTNEDAEKVTQLSTSMGEMVEGYIVELNAGQTVTAVAELNNGVYTGTANIGLGDMNMYFTSNSGNWALYGTSSPLNLVTVTAKSSAQSTVNLDGTDYTGYVYTIVTAEGNKNILLVEGDDFQGIDVTDSSAMSQCAFVAENSILTYNIEYGTAEIGGGLSLSTYKQNLITFNELKYFTSLTSIEQEAFFSCDNLTSVVIPNSVIEIEREAFSNCDNLATVIIPDSVTTIGTSAFLVCTGLTSVTIPNSVTEIGYTAFSGCTSLTSVVIGDSVTSIRSDTFHGCTSLASIVVNSGNPTYDSRDNCNAIIITASDVLFYGCKNTIIPDSVTKISSGAFYDCTTLTSISIPNSVTELGNAAFYGCTSLTSVVMGNSVTKIDSHAFSGCTALTSVNIPNSITRIFSNTFYGCTSLTSITIPASVTYIEIQAFCGCSSLETITSLATTAPSVRNTTFQNVKTGGTLYYPSGSDYSNWMRSTSYYLGYSNWTSVAQ